MAESVIFPKPSGASYVIPDVNDENWGQNVTDYLLALPNGVPPTAGLFTLTGDLSFGSGFGLTVKYLTSITASAADSGVIRLAHADTIGWRNNAGGGNLLLSVDSSDNLLFNGSTIVTGSVVSSITGTSNQVIASASTGAVTLSLPQSIAAASTPTFAGLTIGNSNLTLNNAATVKFIDTGSNYATIQAPATVVTPYALVLPTAQGAASTYLKNDGSGNLSFAAASGNFVSSITGTANQVIASASTGAITLSTPQNIGTSSSPTFASVTITGNLNTALNTSIGGSNGWSLFSNSTLGIQGSPIQLAGDTRPSLDNTYAIGDATHRFTVVHSLGSTLYGSSSGNIQLAAPSAPTSYALTLPTAQGSANQTWINNGSGAMSFATLPVAGGGSGNTTFTAYSVICAGTTATGAFQNVSGVGSSGQALVSNGAAALPTWQTIGGSGTVNSGTAGNLTLYPASSNAVSDIYVQNTKNITLGIAAQASRSANLALTIPNPGNAVTAASVLLTEGAQTINGATTLTAILTMSGATIAMGAQKITGLANGTASTDAAAFGQIYYGFQAAVQATNSTAFTTTSSTFQTSNLSAAITPTSSSHRIRVTVTGDFQVNNTASPAAGRVSIFRGSTNLGDATSGMVTAFFPISVSQNVRVPVSMSYIDSPATTSATTYAVKICNSDNTTTVSFPSAAAPLCSIILEEIV